MKISDLTERTRLQDLIADNPSNIEARRALARHFLQAGEILRAAEQLAAVVEVHLLEGDGAEALRVGRIAMHLDPGNVETRLLMVRVHAAFPGLDIPRAAEPILDLTPEQKLEEIELTDSLEMEVLVDYGPSGRPVRTTPIMNPTAHTGSNRVAPGFDSGDYEDVSALVEDYDELASSGEITAQTRAVSDSQLAVSASGVRKAVSGSASLVALSASGSRPAVSESGTHEPLTDSGSAPAVERRRPASERARAAQDAQRKVVGPASASTSLGELPFNPLFERLPVQSAAGLFGIMSRVEYGEGGTVVAGGEPVDRLVLILSGELRDAATDQEFGAGQLAGAFELLANATAATDLVAESDVVCAEVERDRLDGLRSSDPALGDALAALLRDRLVADLLRRSPIFEGLDEEERASLMPRFFTVDVAPGEVVATEGETNRRLLTVLTGELVVDGRHKIATQRRTLGPGDFFGFVSTILGRPSQVGIVAASPTTLLVLPEQEVERLVAGHKGIARIARKEAIERGELTYSVHTVGGLGGLRVLREPESGEG